MWIHTRPTGLLRWLAVLPPTLLRWLAVLPPTLLRWLTVLPPTLLRWLSVLPPTLLLPLIAVSRRLARTCHDVLLTVLLRRRARLFCTTKTPQAASSA